jgi:hypothetical protein
MVGRAFCKGGDEVRPVSLAAWSRRANWNLGYGVSSRASNILFAKCLPIAVENTLGPYRLCSDDSDHGLGGDVGRSIADTACSSKPRAYGY